MKNMQKKTFLIGGIVFLYLSTSVAPALPIANTDRVEMITECVDVSCPTLTENQGFQDVHINEATGVLSEEGCPTLPVLTKTFAFPLGTQIVSVEVYPSTVETIHIETQIRPVPTKQKISSDLVPLQGILDEEIYSCSTPYPASWYAVRSGAGLNSENDHTLFVTVQINPACYIPRERVLRYSTHFTISISYMKASFQAASSEQYSLMIITPDMFSQALQPLVDHKNSHGVPTILAPLEEIYSSYYGRDNAERIKYFIQDAIEKWGIHYVLLVGDMKHLPIRVTYASWWERDILSDLYYADVFDAKGDFCSWDANDNNRFGEIDEDGNNLDGVDLYADVHVGRLACADETEVSTVVDKIILYEQETYDQIWFKRLILAGGDTFPVSMGAPPFIYEGEITNVKVGQTMPEFEQKFLWTSKGTLHPSSFNRAINRGAGFVSYSGHGFEHGWGTFRPNAITKQKIFYYTPYANMLKNGYQLPVIFFDACLTAKLDFNITDLEHYYGGAAMLLARLFDLSMDPSEFYPCFGWSFMVKEGGGAIATIGSTRTAYTWVDSSGVYGGAGYLNVHFFDAYEDGITIGKMLTSAQNAYIQNMGADYFTLEEFILLGDPSLMTGGYP